MSKKKRIETVGGEPLTQNPFGSLENLELPTCDGKQKVQAEQEPGPGGHHSSKSTPRWKDGYRYYQL